MPSLLRRRGGSLALLSLAGALLLGTGTSDAAIRPGSTATVDVAVATVWTDASKPRGIDAPALAHPVDLPGWLAAMDTDARRALTDHNATQTQALYGRPVDVLAVQGGWAEVAVPGQPTPKDPRGYPGWVPLAQLADRPLQAHGPFVQVERPRAWLYRDAALRRRALEVSFATRLPVLGRRGGAVQAATPDGPRWLAASSVSVHRDARDFPRPTGAALVRTAERFLGVDYVWAGRSGWMFDCSGLTGLVYEAHGITIGRDADVQALDSGGTRVAGHADQSATALRPGDLLFYAGDGGTGSIYHVAMYAGGGRMVEAYAAGIPVRLTPVRFGDDYWGAVRYLR